MCLLCALRTGFAAEAIDAPQDFVLGNRRWTDAGNSSGGTTPSSGAGASGGVVAWSLAGAGLANASGDGDYFSGSTVGLGSFLNFDYVAVLRAAFDAWAAVANIEFIQVADGGGSMGTGTFPTIRIAAGYVDGSGNVLASAYFPSNSAVGGDIVFDSGETTFWTQHSFFLTALHEIGHALGLDHQAGSTPAIMNPTIDLSDTGLYADDINGIRALYGAQDFGPNAYYMPSTLANLTLLDGAPSLTVNGNALGNVISGSTAGETINGGGGDDTLQGGGGNDFLDGGSGTDAYYGGLGDDTMVLAGPSELSRVFDLEHGDKVALKGSAFGLPAGSLANAGVDFYYGTSAASAGPALMFDGATGSLYWDADGSGAGAAVEVAELSWSNGLPGNIGTVGANSQFEAAGDFDKNGVSDVLWRDSATGSTGAWLMNANGTYSWSGMGTVGSDWDVKASGDFDGTGTSDVLWHNSVTGAAGAWLMGNGTPGGWLSLGTPSLDWEVKGAGDFDKNGIDDILWVNNVTKVAGAWLMGANGQPRDWLNLGTINAGWEFKGVGDFNNDGTDDVLFYNTVTRATGAWKIRDGVPTDWWALGTVEAGWSIDGVADLNGDGTDDLHLYNAATDDAKAFTVNNGVVTGTIGQPDFDGSWSLLGTGQFNGSGVEDLMWRKADGTIVINALAVTPDQFIII